VRLGNGVTYRRLFLRHPAEKVHVVTIRPGARVHPLVSLSNDRVAEQPVTARLETTSHSCARLGCVAGINADYFCTGPYCPRDIHEPEGGVVSDGRLLRSPYSTGWAEQQVMLDPRGCPLPPGKMLWLGSVGNRSTTLPLAGVNVDRNAHQVVLYDTAFGPHTPPSTDGAELVARLRNPRWLGNFNQIAYAQPVRWRHRGNTPIRHGLVVFSASPDKALLLQQLWRDHDQIQIRLVPAEPAWNSVGAKPLLLDHGRYTGVWPHQPRNPFSIFAWKSDCTRFLITVDGRQPGSAGMNIQQAAALAARLGATTAYGFDSGGSTTLVGPRGRLLNHPSDLGPSGQRIERRVADSLLFLPDR